MNVRVLFFGATADSAGTREAEIDLPKSVDVDSALSAILVEFPNLGRDHKRKSLLFAINQKYALGQETIQDGDELAVFTAVSGG